MEEWRPVPNFEGLYEVSNQGQVRRVGPDASGRQRYIGRILSGGLTHPGYISYVLWKNRKGKNILGHRIVAEAFLGPPPPGKQTNHKNRDKTDNRAENLEYVTASDNYRHALATGHIAVHGSKHWNSKLTEADVRAIRRLAAGGHTHTSLAPRFGVARTIVTRIVNRTWWKHVV